MEFCSLKPTKKKKVSGILVACAFQENFEVQRAQFQICNDFEK
jgi:hypothetical protein